MKTRLCVSLSAAVLILAAGPALSGSAASVAGQKLDSGLGELPHYSTWADPSGRNPMGRRVAGESLDDGLGELPHYSKWVDKTGRDPMGRRDTQLAQAKNEDPLPLRKAKISTEATLRKVRTRAHPRACSTYCAHAP